MNKYMQYDAQKHKTGRNFENHSVALCNSFLYNLFAIRLPTYMFGLQTPEQHLAKQASSTIC